METYHTISKKQHALFQRLLFRVWERSPFYRDYYSSHGIKEKDLSDLAITDLPLLSKKLFIDNFDRAVTDPRLNQQDLEEWFEHHHDPREKFHNDLVVVHTSGTSGDVGIFAYNMNEWRVADAAFATCLPSPENSSSGKTRVAFYVATNGHFATVSTAHTMPANEYDILVASVMESLDGTVKKLNAFQPHRLTGYSSCVADLADLAVQGKLDIHPQRIFVGGDKLTESMAKKIDAVWQVPIYIMYGASESKYIALKKPEHEHMLVMEDLNIVEMLDADNREVDCNKEGRIVLTNLFNLTLPILRYELGDYVVKGTPFPDSTAATIRDISGRVNDALPVALSPGRNDAIHPILLTTLFAPGIEKYQFVSLRPDFFRVDYVASDNIDLSLKREIQRMLDSKGVTQTVFDVQRVDAIQNDPKTGKLRLVKIGIDPGNSSDHVLVNEEPPGSPRQSEIRAGSSVIASRHEDIQQATPQHVEKQVEENAGQAANSIPVKLVETPEPVSETADSGISSAAERIPIEKNLSRLWCEVLGVDHVNIHDDFFDLNGDSLSMGQIMARTTEEFGIETSFQEFFDTPTVAGMAKTILNNSENKSNDASLKNILDQLDSLSDDDVKKLLKKNGEH